MAQIAHWLQVLDYVWHHHDLGADDTAITMEQMAEQLSHEFIIIKRDDVKERYNNPIKS